MASDELRVGQIAAVVAIVTAILTGSVTYMTTHMQISQAKTDTRDQIKGAKAVTVEQGKLTRKQGATNYENAVKENRRQFRVSQRSGTYTLLLLRSRPLSPTWSSLPISNCSAVQRGSYILM
jgi:hypothetical protein